MVALPGTAVAADVYAKELKNRANDVVAVHPGLLGGRSKTQSPYDRRRTRRFHCQHRDNRGVSRDALCMKFFMMKPLDVVERDCVPGRAGTADTVPVHIDRLDGRRQRHVKMVTTRNTGTDLGSTKGKETNRVMTSKSLGYSSDTEQ